MISSKKAKKMEEEAMKEKKRIDHYAERAVELERLGTSNAYFVY